MAMTKAEVCRAFREAMAADYADVPAKDALNHTFSPEFCAKMDALIAEQKRGSWHLLSRQTRRTLVVAAILAASMLLIACTPRLREAVSELVVTVYKTFVDFVSETDDTPLRTEIETAYTIDPVPESFQLTSSKESGNHYVEKIYTKTNGDQLILYQSTSSVSGLVDSEHCDEVATTVINNNEVLFYLSQQQCIAVWTQDGYYLRIIYYGDIQQSELTNLISQVVPQK